MLHHASRSATSPRRRHHRATARPLLLAVALLAAAAWPATAAASEAVAEWAVYVGAYDFASGAETSEVGAELRFHLFEVPLGRFDLPIEPAAGVMGTGEGSGYLYASLRLPLHELWRDGDPERWRVVPFTGAGIYTAGDGKDLGGPVEFRSGIEVSVRAGERWWVGLSYYHLSNAVLYDLNPGEESLVLVLSRR